MLVFLRLIGIEHLAVDLFEIGNAPTAAGPRGETGGDLRSAVGPLAFHETEYLPPRDVKAIAKRIVKVHPPQDAGPALLCKEPNEREAWPRITGAANEALC